MRLSWEFILTLVPARLACLARARTQQASTSVWTQALVAEPGALVHLGKRQELGGGAASRPRPPPWRLYTTVTV